MTKYYKAVAKVAFFFQGIFVSVGEEVDLDKAAYKQLVEEERLCELIKNKERDGQNENDR